MLTIKCLKCGQLWSIPETYKNQKAKCTCGYEFVVPDLDRFSTISRQATGEKRVSHSRAANTVSRLVKQKKKSAFGDLGTINDELREVLYLQKAGMVTKAESKLKRLLNKDELDSYYRNDKRDFELTAYFLRVYDKSRVFYERKKDFQMAAVYAAMTIYARRTNLKQIGLGSSEIDQKYLNALDKNLEKIGLKNSEVNQTISVAIQNSKTIINRMSLLYDLRHIMGVKS